MTVETTWTIKRLLDWTTDFFKTKELDPARLSAETLLAEALGCKRIELYTQFEKVPAESELARFRDWVKRHAAGEPVAYLAGHKEFYSLRFEVTSDVLIPRPETEHVVMAAIDVAAKLDSATKIIDIGTGSGAIAVALAKNLPNSSILATDISSAALDVARRNAEANTVSQQITYLEGNLWEPIPDDFTPNIVVSNPPYIGRGEVDTVDESVRKFEPDVALFAGDQGTDIIAPLVAEAAQRLSSGGYLIFETSPIIFDQCLEIVAAQSVFDEAKTIKDLAGHRRVIQTRKTMG